MKKRFRIITPFLRFFETESASGIILIIVTLFALLIANSPLYPHYHHFFETPIKFSYDNFEIKNTTHHWINDGLMTIFFLLVGLEIKREIAYGELSSIKKSLVPVVAAVGGMIVPSLIFTYFNIGLPTIKGWAIPTATDIAFSLGILSLMGRRAPYALKVFLATLAIVDDLLAIIVIAVFYTATINLNALVLSSIFTGILAFFSLLKIRNILPYIIVGFFLWLFLLQSGVHSTLTGVIIAFLLPIKSRINYEQFYNKSLGIVNSLKKITESTESTKEIEYQYKSSIQSLEQICEAVQSPSERLEHSIQNWVAFFIVPIFAFANSGLVINTETLTQLGNPVSLGIILGLLVGKPLGIISFSYAMQFLGLGKISKDIHFQQFLGMGFLCGIGFTVAIFVSELAYKTSPEYIDNAKAAILLGSTLATLVGIIIFRITPKPKRAS
ncbi:MAG: Na+/H+ antiporter NhaA [Bacteroidia bacterium]|nr:Na+/H+ antiporter NhaA [Bacteroidia bacterium]MDW8157853.1 Na+/H+ antiporter NhaA [Bacteroidia bacterium]